MFPSFISLILPPFSFLFHSITYSSVLYLSSCFPPCSVPVLAPLSYHRSPHTHLRSSLFTLLTFLLFSCFFSPARPFHILLPCFSTHYCSTVDPVSLPVPFLSHISLPPNRWYLFFEGSSNPFPFPSLFLCSSCYLSAALTHQAKTAPLKVSTTFIYFISVNFPPLHLSHFPHRYCSHSLTSIMPTIPYPFLFHHPSRVPCRLCFYSKLTKSSPTMKSPSLILAFITQKVGAVFCNER